LLILSPPLPLTIFHDRKTSAIDEEGILLTLQHRDRVCHISLALPTSSLQKLLTTMDEQLPILEQMYIGSLTNDTSVVLQKTFYATGDTVLLMGSPLLTTTAGLTLEDIPSFAYFPH
jgi:hypothetical protein